MATKSKKRKGSLLDPRVSIGRNLERKDFKQAVKEARIYFRKSPGDESRRFLEFAYIGRVRQLKSQQNLETCQSILKEFLALPPRELAVLEVLPEVLMWAGMLDKMPGGQSAVDQVLGHELPVKLADQAILSPKSPIADRQLRAEADSIRESLRALSDGDDSAAEEKLRTISRTSPLADWKLFARGLMGYYQYDVAAMNSNWSRLSKSRPASRISQALTVIATQSHFHSGDGNLQDRIRKIEAASQSSGLIAGLEKLGSAVSNADFSAATKILSTIYRTLQSVDPGLLDRLLNWYSLQIVEAGDDDDLDRLARLLPGPVMDPRWNRARAKNEENYETRDQDRVLPCWNAYLQDLEGCSHLSAQDREIACGLVNCHIASIAMDVMFQCKNCNCGEPHDDEIEYLMRLAIRHSEQSIEQSPDDLQAYQLLRGLYDETDETEKAVQVARLALRRFPDQLQASEYLVDHCLAGGNPQEAIDTARLAHRERPLDENAKRLLCATLVSASRIWATDGDFQRARDCFDQVHRFPAGGITYSLLCENAVLELKAGCIPVANERVGRAIELIGEPTPVWLTMMVESRRMQLPADEYLHYETRWLNGLKRCGNSSAAQMCRYLDQQAGQQMSPQRNDEPPKLPWMSAENVKCLFKLLARSKLKLWALDDLKIVCKFLFSQRQLETMEKLSRAGTKRFPDSATFHCLLFMAHLARGPRVFTPKRMKAAYNSILNCKKNTSDDFEESLLKHVHSVCNLLERSHRRPMVLGP